MSKITFSFGKNWQDFLKCLTEERIKNAESSITDFIGIKNFSNKSFLDIGCGSGLFSYCALRLAASPIVSFDYDPFSVKCCQYMREKAGNPAHWHIQQGSVLDQKFLQRLGDFDIVYSWGVLHHTGSMWEAIRNSAQLVKKGGYYYIAIYNKIDGIRGSASWLKVKKLYNASPMLGKFILEMAYIAGFFISSILTFNNPIRYMLKYKSMRGMDFWTDIKDWLGGYPYEFATAEEIDDYIRKHAPSFSLIKLDRSDGLGCNSFLFKRIENG